VELEDNKEDEDRETDLSALLKVEKPRASHEARVVVRSNTADPSGESLVGEICKKSEMVTTSAPQQAKWRAKQRQTSKQP
jgi:hypothetical protein